ncbi:hypothetical protein B9Z55_015457 [Caenorhabditis nigoni]|uniref:Homeobox domain-containing protein n=1 Tax=Caenorhabditis nigoni TaxID=1611254 RepID=A0A2G5UAC7_9PELO|nr:hypothetical protein B9Z55_015457 [Caenorhabditis nigoni]
MENLSTRQIILKTLDHFPSDCFGNVQNHTPWITNQTEKFLNLLYKSLLESRKGAYVNGADLSFLAGKLMERKENKRLSGSSRRSETPESQSEVPSPNDVINVSNYRKMEKIVDSILASSAPEMDTFQIINKTLEYFGPDYFGNEPNISTKVSHRKKFVLKVLYNSLLKIPAGPFVNGFNLSYLAEKMMERRDNLLRWFKRRRFEDNENKLRFSQMAHLEKMSSRTSSFGTPESSIHVTDLSRRTSLSGEDFSDDLEESRCQKTGEILEDSGNTPPCYIDGNVKTSCDECFKKSKLYKLLEDSDNSF